MLHSLISRETTADDEQDDLHVAAVLVEEPPPARLGLLLRQGVRAVGVQQLTGPRRGQAGGGIHLQRRDDLGGGACVPRAGGRLTRPGSPGVDGHGPSLGSHHCAGAGSTRPGPLGPQEARVWRGQGTAVSGCAACGGGPSMGLLEGVACPGRSDVTPTRGGSSLVGPDQEENAMARRDIEFDAEGVTLRGWFYRRGRRRGAGPTIVMAHGFSAVKEMYLDDFAEVFAAAGPERARVRQPQLRRQRRRAPPGDRPLGAGPRLPARHHLRRARCRRSTRDRIGIWGSQLLRRPRARRRRDRPPRQGRRRPGAAGQRARQPARAGPRRLHRRRSGSMFDADRLARFRGEPPAMVPVVDEDPLGPVGAAHPGLVAVVHRDRQEPRPVVAERGARCAASRCSPSTSRAATCPTSAPTPLLMVVAAGDHLTPSDLAIAAFEPGARAQAAGDPARAGTSTPTSRASRSPSRPPATGSCSTSRPDPVRPSAAGGRTRD